MPTNRTVQKLQRVFEALAPAMQSEVITATFNEASRLARSMTFEASRGATTNLRDSIRVERAKRPTRALVRAGGPKTTRNGYDYALANEFGTEKMKAQPFFWPTYRAERKRIRRDLTKAVKAALAKQIPIKG